MKVSEHTVFMTTGEKLTVKADTVCGPEGEDPVFSFHKDGQRVAAFPISGICGFVAGHTVPDDATD